MQRLPHGDLGKLALTLRRRDHLSGDPPSDPLLHGLGQCDRIVSGIVKGFQHAPVRPGKRIIERATSRPPDHEERSSTPRASRVFPSLLERIAAATLAPLLSIVPSSRAYCLKSDGIS